MWPNRIFGADRVREMLNVHLYFVKLFGCHIAGNNIPIDITGFSDAIMHGKLHPRVYLKFGVRQDIRRQTAGRHDRYVDHAAAGWWLQHLCDVVL